ncbi:MAG: DUF5319 family protein [Actinomycetota bacterium]
MEDEPGSGEEAPLDEEEIQALRQDLVDVEILKDVLGPRGIKGTVFFCQDCEEDHYLTWDLLAGNLRELLDKGESPVHEPAFDPDPDDYVTWDYARGFLDGYESFEQEELGALSARLATELTRRGFRLDEIKAVMSTLGLQAPAPDTVPGDGEGR